MQMSNNLAQHYDAKVYGGPVDDYFIETRVDYSVTQLMYDEVGAKNAYIGVYI